MVAPEGALTVKAQSYRECTVAGRGVPHSALRGVEVRAPGNTREVLSG